ncbi:hypothetical protein GCM10009846_03380 [Agrococcus versicolor]|uniref:DUF2029 domain-containing protein n=1 Tax=Agrococcus versicolor TaxID=501482 RepID=A0ABN3AJK3_9MICO
MTRDDAADGERAAQHEDEAHAADATPAEGGVEAQAEADAAAEATSPRTASDVDAAAATPATATATREREPWQPGRVGRALDRAQGRVGSVLGRAGGAVGGSVVGRWFRRTEQPGVVDWLLLGALALLAFVTFLYGDVRATYEHSMNFLDAVFTGRLQDFYQIAIDNNSFGHPAVYDVPVYLVFGIWNLPTYLIHQLTGFDYLNSMPAQLWLKAMMVFFLVLAAKTVVDIARTAGMTRQRARWVGFFLLSSMAAFVPVLVIVQYDIVSVALMLLGIHAYMRGRTRSFLLWFLAANTMKLFAVFVFVPLILLREKRLIPAAAQIVVGMLGLVACRLLYRGDLAYAISTGGFTDDMIDRLTISGFDWHSGITVPAFVVIMVCLVAFAYLKRITSDRERIAFAIYIPLVAFLSFCVLVPLNPYWITLVAPFAVLIIFLNPRFLVFNTLVETATGMVLLVTYGLVGFSMYNAGIFDDLLLGELVAPAASPRWSTLQSLLSGAGLGEYAPFLVGFLVAALILTLVVNYPRRAFVLGMPNVERVPRTIVLVRLGAIAAFLGLLFAMYLAPARPVAYSSTSGTPVANPTDLLVEGNVVEQELEFDDALEVSSLEVGFDAQVSWLNTAAVTVELLGPDGASVYTGSAPVNTLGVGVTAFDTGDLVLDAGETYTLRLTAGQSDAGGQLLVQLNPEQDSFVTTSNGLEVPGDVVLVLDGAVR